MDYITKKISIIYITAREDFPQIGCPNLHQFDVFLDSVARQRWAKERPEDFEVVIVDVLKNKGVQGSEVKYLKRDYDFNKYNYKIKHITPHDNWWLDHNYSCYCGFQNSGVIAANGELLIFFDDSSEIIGNNFLEIHWDWYKEKGKDRVFPHSIHEYYEGGKPLIASNKIMREPSYDALIKTNKIYSAIEVFSAGGYFSLSLEVLLELNGFNELFDGAKGIEDGDLQYRAGRVGCRSLVDIRLRVVENSHAPVVFHALTEFFRDNVPIVKITRQRGPSFFKANRKGVTQEEYDQILIWNKELYPNFKETELCRRTLTHPPIFDLKQLRKEYHEIDRKK